MPSLKHKPANSINFSKNVKISCETETSLMQLRLPRLPRLELRMCSKLLLVARDASKLLRSHASSRPGEIIMRARRNHSKPKENVNLLCAYCEHFYFHSVTLTYYVGSCTVTTASTALLCLLTTQFPSAPAQELLLPASAFLRRKPARHLSQPIWPLPGQQKGHRRCLVTTQEPV